VPRNAVLPDEQGIYLFQVENGHAKRVDVTSSTLGGSNTLGVISFVARLGPILPASGQHQRSCPHWQG